ncbi:MAG: choice-of-anchor D domain-containing protein, partial [Candidatus Sumerlaeota bacterium]|nr:choice-of-anchor D domain-containing protein [Candidatus Sumerlaeota bacterium]
MKAFAKSWFPRAGMLFLGLGFALTTGSSSWAGEVFHETFDDVAVVAYAPNAAGNVGSGVAGDQTDELGWTYTMSASGVVEIKDLGSPFFRHPERTVKVGNIIFEVPLAAGINIDDVVSVTMKAAFAFPTNSGTSTNQGLNLYLYNTVLGQSATQPGYMLSMSADTDASPIRVYTLAGSSGATGVGTIGDFGANIYVLTVKYTRNVSTTVEWSVTSPNGGVLSESGSLILSGRIPDTTVLDRLRIVWTASATGWVDDIIIEVETPGPEAEIKDGGTTIADGGGPVDFGTALLGGAALSKTFTVNNVGTTDLTTSPTIVPAGYTLTEPLSATIPAGGSDTFTVELPTTAGGTFAGEISFENNDS